MIDAAITPINEIPQLPNVKCFITYRPIGAPRVSGLTMVELMVTIAIFAILSMLAAPSFNQVMASSRLSSATNELNGSLALAKSEAVRSGSRVTVCPSTNGTSCVSTGTPTWSTGWIVFRDLSRSGTSAAVDVGDTIVQNGQDLNNQIVIVASTPYASFASDGTSRQIDGNSLASVIRVCSQSSSVPNDRRARDISILRSGRIEVSTPTGISSSCPAPPAPT